MARFGVGTFMKWNIMTAPVVYIVGAFAGICAMTTTKQVMSGKPLIGKK